MTGYQQTTGFTGSDRVLTGSDGISTLSDLKYIQDINRKGYQPEVTGYQLEGIRYQPDDNEYYHEVT